MQSTGDCRVLQCFNTLADRGLEIAYMFNVHCNLQGNTGDGVLAEEHHAIAIRRLVSLHTNIISYR